MYIQVLKTGSSGNAYLVKDGVTTLLLDAGLRYGDINRKTGYHAHEIDGVLVTHEHGDHACGLQSLHKRTAANFYMSNGTASAVPPLGRRLFRVEAGKPFGIGTFLVMPFETVHDAAEPLGFYLYSSETKESLLYITDTAYVKNTFKSVNYLLVECNYDEATLRHNLRNSKLDETQARRLYKTHFGLKGVVSFLEANDLSKLKRIYLLHMSDRNANELHVKQTIQRTTGALVTVA